VYRYNATYGSLSKKKFALFLCGVSQQVTEEFLLENFSERVVFTRLFDIHRLILKQPDNEQGIITFFFSKTHAVQLGQ